MRPDRNIRDQGLDQHLRESVGRDKMVGFEITEPGQTEKGLMGPDSETGTDGTGGRDKIERDRRMGLVQSRVFSESRFNT